MRLIVRHKGQWRNGAAESANRHFLGKVRVQISFLLYRKGVQFAPFLAHFLHINFCGDQSAGEQLTLCQDNAVFCDEIMTGEYYIRGGFPIAGVGIDIPAQQTGRLAADQLPTIFGFPDDLIAGRQIDNDGGACHGVLRGRRQRRPEVFTDFYSEGEILLIETLKQQTGAKGHRILQTNGLERVGIEIRFIHSSLEVTLFIKFAVSGQRRLGHDAQHIALLDDNCTVEELALMHQRRTNDGYRLELAACLD